ncbi:hypothetical protein LOTGIDRAFT_118867 [Lottia gigantea]|uniref:Transporter n=1 Tax=Lottia gigantea TaxID=225164 RepID=V3ZRZ5_LOTGI|nr:hypothetical protein LOTGIDRAFT_118867 [Lottia gigantea]ESO94203.1 hypothetical protein LOTGIDRAFT_118867 [Lottia gigantea]
MESPPKVSTRMKWKGNCDFMLSMIGYGVGLGNIWRFPYLCALNGGAVFLIPYAVFMVLLGFPIAFLELTIGQYSGKSCFDVWDICPALRGLGLSATGLSAVCSIYYNTILAWMLYFMINSFTSPLPWTTCNNWWNTESSYFLKSLANNMSIDQDHTNTSKAYTAIEEFWNHNVLRMSGGIDELGSIQWHLVVALAVAWFIIYLCLFKGVESVGRVVYVTATLPFILITIILIKAATLPGSINGLKFYLIPDFSKLGELQVWLQAGMQLFYSMGIGWGSFMTMASYNKFDNNLLRDTIIYCFVGEGTSVYAGFAVFAILGYMSHLTGLEVADLVRSGPGLIFITYPEALASLPIPQLWAVLFLLMVLMVAVDSMFVTVEVCATTFTDMFNITSWKKRSVLTAVMCAIMFLVSLIYATNGGIYVFQLVDWYMSSVTMYIITVLECLVIGWIYGAERYYNDIEQMLGRRPPIIFKILWKFVTPTIIFSVLIMTLTQYQLPTLGYYKYPPVASVFGWIIALSTALPIPIWMIKEIYSREGTLMERIKSSFRPNSKWGPVKDYVEPTMESEF